MQRLVLGCSKMAYGLTEYQTGPLTLFMRHNRPNLEEIEEVLPSCFCVMTSSPLWRLRSWHWEKVRPTNWTNMYSVYLNKVEVFWKGHKIWKKSEAVPFTYIISMLLWHRINWQTLYLITLLLCFCTRQKYLFHIGCERVWTQTRGALQHTQTPTLDHSAIETKLENFSF